MIPHIKALRDLSLGELVEDLLLGSVAGRTEPANAEADESLDVLVRHAMRADASAEPDGRRIWDRLRGRVKGPGGALAVEGPANVEGGDPTEALLGAFALPDRGSVATSDPNTSAQWSPDVCVTSLFRLPSSPMAAR